MAISDLPGYVQGYKFTDSAAYYDSTNKYFIDQAGYSAFPASRLEITTGTPSFVDVNSARGMVLDNTVQGYLNPFPMWHGSMIVVMGGPSLMTSNQNLYVLIGGGVTSGTGNCRLWYMRVSAADYRARQVGIGGSNGEGLYGSDAIFATCISGDQENRVMKGLESDGTVNTGSTVADNNKGVEFFHDVGTTDRTYATRMRFGNLSGVKGDTAALVSGNSMIICELHFFNSILTDVPTTAVEAELTALETIYG